MPTARITTVILLLLLLLLAAAALGGCGDRKLPGVYRIDIQQGNVVNEAQLARLERGMSKRKVQFILGTPLIVDVFNQDRWDYLYSFQEGGGNRLQRRVSLFFDNDRLARIEGDVKPGVMASDPEPAPKDKVVSVPDPEPRGLFGRLAGLLGGDRPQRPAKRDAREAPASSGPDLEGARLPPGSSAPEPPREE